MDSETLTRIAESTELDDSVREMAGLLSEACSDWPVFNLKKPSELVKEIRCELDGRLTLERLAKYADSLHPVTDAWKLTAMTALLEFFRIATTQGLPDAAELEDAVCYLECCANRSNELPNKQFDTDASRRST